MDMSGDINYSSLNLVQNYRKSPKLFKGSEELTYTKSISKWPKAEGLFLHPFALPESLLERVSLCIISVNFKMSLFLTITACKQ